MPQIGSIAMAGAAGAAATSVANVRGDGWLADELGEDRERDLARVAGAEVEPGGVADRGDVVGCEAPGEQRLAHLLAPAAAGDERDVRRAGAEASSSAGSS